MSLSDRIDRVVTHRIWGIVIFLGVMAVLFQAIFSWAAVPMAWIKDGFDLLGGVIAGIVPPGDLQDLLIRGGLAGVAAVVTFLPQILFLFLFLGFLEDTGYMARAAFIMDRLMSKVGLHGKSFIPLLSSFACAIPGIMATRTIDNPKDRLATMLVAPADELQRAPAGVRAADRGVHSGGRVLGVLSLRRNDAALNVSAWAGRGSGHGLVVQEDVSPRDAPFVPDGASPVQAPFAEVGSAIRCGNVPLLS